MACKKTAHVLEVVCRYHIWCAHALAKEDRAVFDPKINDENMEKTLTSIEQVYQDLSYKHQSSDSEAEFRVYMIYLSLNETNVVMKHLSRIPKKYQNSGKHFDWSNLNRQRHHAGIFKFSEKKCLKTKILNCFVVTISRYYM